LSVKKNSLVNQSNIGKCVYYMVAMFRT